MPPLASGLAAEWDGNTPFESSATVRTAGATSISTTLAEAGIISGTAPSAWKATALLWNPDTTQFERLTYSTTAAGGTYQIGALPAGEYLVQFIPTAATGAAEYWKSRTTVWDSLSISVETGQTVPNINLAVGSAADTRKTQRVSGIDRWETSALVSELGFPPAGTVFLTSGLNYPDALIAGPAAALLGAPLLLTDPASLPLPIAEELERLQPNRVVIVGGTTGVSTNVVSELGLLVPSATIVRIEGIDRYDAARKLARFAFGGYDNGTAYVAVGSNYPDALAAAAAAGLEHAPLVLDNGSGTLDPATTSLLQDLGIDRVVIVGGGVPASTETLIRNLGFIKQVVRRSGVDRYTTSSNIGAGAFRAADTALLTTGLNYPDALSGAALAGIWGAPLYLVEPNCVPVATLAELQRLRPQMIYVLGNNNSLSVRIDDLSACP